MIHETSQSNVASRPASAASAALSAPATTLNPTTLRLLQTAAVVTTALLITAAAQVRIVLPFTPVPVVLSDMVVLSAGVALGGRLGLLSVLFYLLLGVTGSFVFAGGEHAGIATMFGATGGYLLAFALVQPLLGRLTLGTPTTLRLAGAVALAYVAILALGTTWLAISQEISAATAIQKGVLPFLPIAVLKLALVTGLGRLALAKLRPTLDPRSA